MKCKHCEKEIERCSCVFKGFCAFKGFIHTGKSETCGVGSDPTDADTIKMFDYFQGIEQDPDLENKNS